MSAGAFASCLRVSAERQGRSGRVLEAQRRAVADFLTSDSWRRVAELVEVSALSEVSLSR